MTWKTRLLVRESIFTAAAFTFAAYLYFYLTFWAAEDLLKPSALTSYLTSPAVHVELLGMGILFGGLIGVINRATETPRLRQRPLFHVILIRTTLYVVGMALVFLVLMAVFAAWILPRETITEMYTGIPPRFLVSFPIWLAVVVGLINLALEVERVLGPGNLWRLFIGRYRRPREERRVFLFVDLMSSTTIAEQLGHEAFSELLQTCYQDLNAIVLRYQADVNQYVGDEVVMSWSSDVDDENLRESVLTSFAFQKVLREKQDWYLERFGVAPRFRSGIDVGSVTVIEVGDVKRQIAFHGDVLNTAARLLEVCKSRGESLIASAAIGDSLRDDPGFETQWLGDVPLRGKMQPIRACALRTTSHVS